MRETLIYKGCIYTCLTSILINEDAKIYLQNQIKIPSAFNISKHMLNRIAALEYGEMTSGKKPEVGLPSPFVV